MNDPGTTDPIPEPEVPVEEQVGRHRPPEEPARAVGVEGQEASGQECPNCHTPSPEEAMFCEACGYDFVTGAPPLLAEGRQPPPTSEQSRQPHEMASGASAHRDAAAEASGHLENGPISPHRDADDDPDAGASTPVPAVPPPVPPLEEDSRPAHEHPEHLPPSRRQPHGDWVVEVWVDRAWYDRQDSDQPAPAQAAPLVVPVRGQSMVLGRASESLGVRPDVDCGEDLGVSRQHAKLTTDGHRFWVHDLGGPNGTFVGTVGEPHPRRPIGEDEQVEVDADDRIWLGSWTRVVVRPAHESERVPDDGG